MKMFQFFSTVSSLKHARLANVKITGAITLSVLLAAQMGRAQTVGNLVFTEVSSTQLLVTLNGTPIGNWQPFGITDQFEDSVQAGTVSVPGSPFYLAFLDPLNPGKASTLTGAIPFQPYNLFDIDATLVPTSLSDFLPYSQSGAQVYDGTEFTPVNITVQGSAALTIPEAVNSGALFAISLAGLGVLDMSRRSRKTSFYKKLFLR
jgi:hypothetical protein